MSLILPPWYFTDETDNITAAVGTSFTCNANSADGTAVRLIPASGGLTHDAHLLVVRFHPDASNFGYNPICLVDILTDPAGGTSWGSIIDDLLIAAAGPGDSPDQAYQRGFIFPIWIPSGSSIGVRGRAHHTSSQAVRCHIWAFGNPSRPELWWCGTKVETLGTTASPAAGTAVTPGYSPSWGSWTSIGSVTTGTYGWIQLGHGGENTTTQSNQNMFCEIGAGSQKLPGTGRYWIGHNTSEQSKVDHTFPSWCNIPEGTQMQARIMSGTASPAAVNLALYGVY